MKKFLLLAAVLLVLVLPASASAAISPYYSYDTAGQVTLACVAVDTSGLEQNGSITVRLYTPDGKPYNTFRTWAPFPTQTYGVCVQGAEYLAQGGYGWTAVVRHGHTPLGSTVF